MKKFTVATILLLIISSGAVSAVTPGGRGMLFGKDHAFTVTAISDWVLDNESGVNQGLYMVFYPKGQSWSKSPVIIYGRSIPLVELKSVQDMVDKTVEDFHENGSPNYRSQKQPAITLPNGNQVQLYYFSGDRWGNYEAAAYVKEVDTINYLVFNSRTKENFNDFVKDFIQIVKSYENLYRPPDVLGKQDIEKLRNESARYLTKKGGKDYESKAASSIGQTMADAMGQCTSYLSEKQQSPFSYFVRIARDGSIKNSYIYPSNALSVCFSGLMSHAKYPTHSFNAFLLNIEMKVTP